MQIGSSSYSATRSVANGITTISARKTRFSTISVAVEALEQREGAVVDDPEAADQREAEHEGEVLAPLVAERLGEVAVGHVGTSRVSTSSVIAIAMTPSLKATTRANSISPSPRDCTIPRVR